MPSRKGFDLDLSKFPGATVKRNNVGGLFETAPVQGAFRKCLVGPPVPGHVVSPIPEHDVQRTLQAIASVRGVNLDRNNTGAVRSRNRAGKERLIRYGLGVGSADLIGMLPPSGRFFAVEVKRFGERPTPEQVAWLQARNAWGGVATWCDSAEALNAVLDWFLDPAAGSLGIDLRDDGSYDVVERKEVVR